MGGTLRISSRSLGAHRHRKPCLPGSSLPCRVDLPTVCGNPWKSTGADCNMARHKIVLKANQVCLQSGALDPTIKLYARYAAHSAPSPAGVTAFLLRCASFFSAPIGVRLRDGDFQL